MKKLIAILLFLFMIIFAVSCSSNQNTGNGGKPDNGDGTGDSENSGGDDEIPDNDTSGDNSGGGTSGDNTSGGTSGDNTSGGNSGGNTSGGTSGGNTSGGTSGGNTSGDNSGGSSDSGSSGGSDSGTSGGDTELTDEEQLFEAFFDPHNHISIWLDIPDSELKKIQQDYEHYSSFGSKSPIYRMADMHVTITTPDGQKAEYVIEQVGVRMKGNTSRTSFYSDNDGMYNLVHFKVSFGETFDEVEYYGDDALTWTDTNARKERKNRTFATLEKIDMRWNRNDDPTYIRETYAYELYREFGVLAPHTTCASIDIGDDHAGVWLIYEPIDKIFLEKNLPAEAIGGDLYKLGWTHEGATFTSFSSYGVEDEDAGKFYVYDLKTNKKTSTHESLKTLINTLNSGSLSKTRFESVVDLENFLYYSAVSYMIGNPDDLRNNYNNTYIYFRPDTGKMILIPYDMDRGLGVNTWNPYGNGMTTDSPFQTYNVCGDQRTPLFKKTISQGGMYISEFTEALKVVDASDMLTNFAFTESYNLARSLYKNDTATSKTYHNADWCSFTFDIRDSASPSDSSNMSFADYLSMKRDTLYSYIGDLGNDKEDDVLLPDDDTDTTPDDGGETPDTGETPDDGGESPDDSEEEVRDPIENCVPYIRADFTNWDVWDEYKMKDNGDGTFSISFSKTHGVKIKVYDRGNNAWYGSEVVDKNCTVEYHPDDHTNIYLDSGSYTITFDANTVTIYIKKH